MALPQKQRNLSQQKLYGTATGNSNSNADPEKQERLTYQNAACMSFFRLAEELLPNPEARKPFHNICGLMRKCGVKSVLIHRDVLNDTISERNYATARKEIESLTALYPAVELVADQVTFFPRRIRSNSKVLPASSKIHLQCTIPHTTHRKLWGITFGDHG